MKQTLLLCSLVAITLAVWPATPHSQTRAAVPTAVARRVAAGQPVSVIVGVSAGFAPEGALADGAAVDAQRAAVVRATADVMTRASGAGVVVGEALDVLPFFTARVDQVSLEALAALPGVRSIELNVAEPIALASSVPITNAPAVWAAGATGTGWNVAIIDTGVENTHSFFGGRVVGEACYTNAGGTGTGTSTCPGGGYASTAVGSGVPCTATNDCRHGTHVAGIAAGANGPGGVNGMAPGAGIVAINAFTRFDSSVECGSAPVPCALAYTSDQVLALQRVAALAGAGNAGKIASVNMSLGGGQYSDQATCDANNASRKTAIDNLRSLGVAVVVASGNNGFASSLNAPGCISSAVSVGAITDALAFSSFTNNAPFLSLLAPGSDVVSSVPGNTYTSFNGTSMATPHVAGAWALLKQAAPTATVDQVLNALKNTGTRLADQRGSGTPHVLINVDAARRMLITPAGAAPGQPTNVNAVASGSTLSVSWGAPTSGGAPTGYTLVARTALNGPVAVALPVGNVLSFSTAAPNGTFFLSLVATNASGTSLESQVTTVTLPGSLALPGTPSGLAVSVVGSTATFSWTAPSSGGPVADYVLIAGYTPGFAVPAVSLALPAAPTSAAIPGVPPGVYYARVYARNAVGNGAFSSNEVTVNVAAPSAPGAPILNAPSVVAGTVSLSWSAGAGDAPTSYTLFASVVPGGAPVATVPLTGNAVAFGGVPAGTYYLRMTASNSVGTSGLSNQVTLTVP